MNKDAVRWMLSTERCYRYIQYTVFTAIYIYFFSYGQNSPDIIAIAKLPSELEVAVVTARHLTVEYTDVNMHTS